MNTCTCYCYSFVFPAELGKTLHPDIGPPDQRLALHILHNENLVPEHIEKRTIYNPMQPAISQVHHPNSCSYTQLYH